MLISPSLNDWNGNQHASVCRWKQVGITWIIFCWVCEEKCVRPSALFHSCGCRSCFCASTLFNCPEGWTCGRVKWQQVLTLRLRPSCHFLHPVSIVQYILTDLTPPEWRIRKNESLAAFYSQEYRTVVCCPTCSPHVSIHLYCIAPADELKLMKQGTSWRLVLLKSL